MAGVIGLLAGTLALVPGSAGAVPVVPASQAGSIETWGADSGGTYFYQPSSLESGPWSGVSLGLGVNTFEIKADGALVRTKTNGRAMLDIPTAVSGTVVRAVSSYADKAAAVTADGAVHIWGDENRGVKPAVHDATALGAKAVDVELGSQFGVVLLEDGRVVMLTAFNPAYEMVTLLEDVEQIDAVGSIAFARIDDGGIVAVNTSWATVELLPIVPSAIAGDSLEDPVANFSVSPAGVGAVAVTEAGDLHVWEVSTGNPIPGSVFPDDEVGGTPVLVASAGSYFAAVTDTKEVLVWGSASDVGTPAYIAVTDVPETVQGQNVVALDGAGTAFAAVVAPPLPPLAETAAPTIAGNLTVGSTLTATEAAFEGSPDSVSNVWFADDAPIEGLPTTGAASRTLALTSAHLGKQIAFQSTAFRAGEDPVVSTLVEVGPVVAPALAVATPASVNGLAQVGQTLTGTPAVFNDAEVAVTNQWLAAGEPIAGATGVTLVLTPALVGKNITFKSTATRGDETESSTSSPVGPVVVAPVVAVASTTGVSAAASTYGKPASVTVTVANGAGLPVDGTVTLTGAGAPQAAAVAGGVATFQLDKALAAGAYTLTASYSGSPTVQASSGAVGFTVTKAKSKKPAFKVNKASTSKKKGKATVTIGSSSGLAKATGKATVTLKNGRTTKRIKVTLSNGKRSISLPKLKKGTWKIQVSYNGDRNYVAQKSKTYKVKVRK